MSEIEKQVSDKDLKKLLSLVKTYTGITMEERKRDLLITRIRPRMRKLNLKTFEEYIDKVQSDLECKQDFINLSTTNETHFFRTEPIWTYFEKEYLPEWFSKNKDSTLRVWSAAASYGAEAYSVAMLCEEFKLKNPSFKYRVFASDISTNVLKDAAEGLFGDKILEEIKTKKPVLHQKYFQALSPTTGQIVEPLRKQVEFSVHNLHQRSSRKDFYDIVFLRNVMIYFSESDNEMVLSYARETLKQNGLLVVGESESLARLKTEFQFSKPLIYQKRAA